IRRRRLDPNSGTVQRALHTYRHLYSIDKKGEMRGEPFFYGTTASGGGHPWNQENRLTLPWMWPVMRSYENQAGEDGCGIKELTGPLPLCRKGIPRSTHLHARPPLPSPTPLSAPSAPHPRASHTRATNEPLLAFFCDWASRR